VSSQVKKEMEVINNKAAGTAKDPQAPQVDE
jgi:PAS domain S-box-containing protein